MPPSIRTVPSAVIPRPAPGVSAPDPIESFTALIRGVGSAVAGAAGASADQVRAQAQQEAAQHQIELVEQRLETDRIRQQAEQNRTRTMEMQIFTEQARDEYRRLRDLEVDEMDAILRTGSSQQVIESINRWKDPENVRRFSYAAGQRLARDHQNTFLTRWQELSEGSVDLPTEAHLSDAILSVAQEMGLEDPLTLGAFQQEALASGRSFLRSLAIARINDRAKVSAETAWLNSEAAVGRVIRDASDGSFDVDAFWQEVDTNRAQVERLDPGNKAQFTRRVVGWIEDAIKFQDPTVSDGILQKIAARGGYYADAVAPLREWNARRIVKAEQDAEAEFITNGLSILENAGQFLDDPRGGLRIVQQVLDRANEMPDGISKTRVLVKAEETRQQLVRRMNESDAAFESLVRPGESAGRQFSQQAIDGAFRRLLDRGVDQRAAIQTAVSQFGTVPSQVTQEIRQSFELGAGFNLQRGVSLIRSIHDSDPEMARNVVRSSITNGSLAELAFDVTLDVPVGSPEFNERLNVIRNPAVTQALMNDQVLARLETETRAASARMARVEGIPGTMSADEQGKLASSYRSHYLWFIAQTIASDLSDEALATNQVAGLSGAASEYAMRRVQQSFAVIPDGKGGGHVVDADLYGVGSLATARQSQHVRDSFSRGIQQLSQGDVWAAPQHGLRLGADVVVPLLARSEVAATPAEALKGFAVWDSQTGGFTRLKDDDARMAELRGRFLGRLSAADVNPWIPLRWSEGMPRDYRAANAWRAERGLPNLMDEATKIVVDRYRSLYQNVPDPRDAVDSSDPDVMAILAQMQQDIMSSIHDLGYRFLGTEADRLQREAVEEQAQQAPIAPSRVLRNVR